MDIILTQQSFQISPILNNFSNICWTGINVFSRHLSNVFHNNIVHVVITLKNCFLPGGEFIIENYNIIKILPFLLKKRKEKKIRKNKFVVIIWKDLGMSVQVGISKFHLELCNLVTWALHEPFSIIM